jgi:hypothetical protein
MTATQICALESIHHVDLVTLTTGRRDLMPTATATLDCLMGIEPMVRHRSPAHVSPASDGSTCYRTPEERGMKMDLHTNPTTTALLRTANSVDTLETNSLCCAAAGIIAPLSAAAEALIPHEKLREAATPDATLIAKNRPPAQPVVGYVQVSGYVDALPNSTASRGSSTRQECLLLNPACMHALKQSGIQLGAIA